MLELILEMPSAIPLGGDALGKRYETRIAERPTTLTVPAFRWSRRGQRYLAVAPTMTAAPPGINWADYLTDETHYPWGMVDIHHAGTRKRVVRAWIKHVVAIVPVPRRWSMAAVSEHAALLHRVSYDWWSKVKDWVEVYTLIALESAELPENQALVANTRVWFRDGERRHRIPVQQGFHIRVDRRDGVRQTGLAKILAKVAMDESPPAMHLFLRNARQALVDTDPRTAVVESATAAEFVVRDLLNRRITDPRVIDVLSDRATLGRYASILANLGVPLPERLNDRLVAMRNRALHQGIAPSMDQARDAVEVATLLVEQVSPRARLLS